MEVLFIVEPLLALTAPPQAEMNNLKQQQIKQIFGMIKVVSCEPNT